MRLTLKGDSDATDLTDGKFSQRADRHIWFESAAVGWSYGGRVLLALDLGRPARIDEIAIRLLGGSFHAGGSVPGWVEAFTSDDGEHFRKVAEFSRWKRRRLRPLRRARRRRQGVDPLPPLHQSGSSRPVDRPADVHQRHDGDRRVVRLRDV